MSAPQNSPLILAIPSKGRLKEQVEAWLADAGLPVSATTGGRGYTARIAALPRVEVRLLSASDIAGALESGEVHLGVTGEDLLRERIADLESRVMLLRALGVGRADLIVAVPKSWLDVETMADLEEVAHMHLVRTGRRLRVATKYIGQTRTFFAGHGIADYRIVESGGATEGAPASGAAEIIVDITTTGATLAANHLKILSDGVILKSQAQLAASLAADWDDERLAVIRQMLGLVEARARAKGSVMLVWPRSGTRRRGQRWRSWSRAGLDPAPTVCCWPKVSSWPHSRCSPAPASDRWRRLVRSTFSSRCRRRPSRWRRV